MKRIAFSLNSNYIAGMLMAAVALTVGCSNSVSSTAAGNSAIQKQLVLKQQPADVSSLKATYANFQSDPIAAEQPVAEQAATEEPTGTEELAPTEKTAVETKTAEPNEGLADSIVTVAGRIYAQGMSPFDTKESVFTIMELPKPGHNHEDPGDCPFCLRELKNAKIAIVRVTDSSGKTYPQSADKLLGLSKSQDIVVRGKASQVGDTLVIELQSLYVLPAEAATELSNAFHSESNS